MESQTQALALTRIVLAKDDLVEQLRSRIPAEWPQCVDEFLTVVRPFDPMSPGVFLAVFADIFHELQRIAGRAATRADGMPLSILIDPCALELSTGGLCDRFERDLRASGGRVSSPGCWFRLSRHGESPSTSIGTSLSR